MSAIRRSASSPKLSRRDFLGLVTSAMLTASGVLAAGGLLRFLNYAGAPPRKTQFDLGPATAYAVGSRTILPDVPALLMCSASGFKALSLVCTHLGCTVEEKADGFICPCHGSRYDVDGKVLQGPAMKALPNLRIETAQDGHLILHTD